MKTTRGDRVPWTPIEDLVIGYLSREPRPRRCELGDFIHECGLLPRRSNRGIQGRYEVLQKQRRLPMMPRWTKRQTERLIEEWDDRALTMAVAIDTIEAIGKTVLPHPPVAVLCRIAAIRCRSRYEAGTAAKPSPQRRDGRKIIPLLRSPQHFDWLEWGQRRQALMLATQGGSAVFAYLDLCQTPLVGPCK